MSLEHFLMNFFPPPGQNYPKTKQKPDLAAKNAKQSLNESMLKNSLIKKDTGLSKMLQLAVQRIK